MRALFASALLLVGVLIGHSGSGLSAQGEDSPAGLVAGDVVDIIYPSPVTGANLRCTVTGVRGGYVRCKDETDRGFASRPQPETWHNLRIAHYVTKVPKDSFLIR